MYKIDTNKIDYYVEIRELANQNNNNECWEICDCIIRKLSYGEDAQELVKHLREIHCEYCI